MGDVSEIPEAQGLVDVGDYSDVLLHLGTAIRLGDHFIKVGGQRYGTLGVDLDVVFVTYLLDSFHVLRHVRMRNLRAVEKQPFSGLLNFPIGIGLCRH